MCIRNDPSDVKSTVIIFIDIIYVALSGFWCVELGGV